VLDDEVQGSAVNSELADSSGGGEGGTRLNFLHFSSFSKINLHLAPY